MSDDHVKQINQGLFKKSTRKIEFNVKFHIELTDQQAEGKIGFAMRLTPEETSEYSEGFLESETREVSGKFFFSGKSKMELEIDNFRRISSDSKLYFDVISVIIPRTGRSSMDRIGESVFELQKIKEVINSGRNEVFSIIHGTNLLQKNKKLGLVTITILNPSIFKYIIFGGGSGMRREFKRGFSAFQSKIDDYSSRKLSLEITPDLPHLSELEKNGKISLGIRSTINRKAGSEVFTTLREDGDPVNQSSIYGPVKVDIPLERTKDLPKDSRIYIELITSTTDSDGRMTPNRDGEASHEFESFREQLSKTRTPFADMNLNYHQMRGRDNRSTKTGKFRVKVLNPDLLKEVSFRQGERYDILDENMEYIKSSLERYGKAYNETFHNRENLVPELKSVGFPYENEEVILPGKMLFVDSTEGRDPESEEVFIGNLLQVALDRKGKTSEWFSKTVNGKLLKGTFDQDVTTACEIFGNSITALPTMRSYKSDQGYFRGRLTNVEDMNQFPERLDEVSGNFSASDCEDQASSILRIGRRIQEGQFKDPVLKDYQKLSRFYIISGCLASIQEAQLSDSDKYSSNKMYVGEDVSGRVKIGAHMFALAINYPSFRKMVHDGPRSSDASLLNWDLEEEHFPIGEKLPTLFLEGTGSLNPLIHPPQCYTLDPKVQNEKRFEHYSKTNIGTLIGSNLPGIGSGIIEKIPIHKEDEPGLLPIFYRYFTELNTDSFNKTGDCFVFSDGRRRGIDVRSFSLSSNLTANLSHEKYFVNPTLEMVPRENSFDSRVFMNLRHQLPISPNQSITQEKVHFIQSSLTRTGVKRFDTLDNLNSAFSKITSGRSKVSKLSNPILISASFRNDELFDKIRKDGKISLVNEILMEVKNTNSIIGAEANIKYFSNSNHSIDINFQFDPSLVKSDMIGRISSGLSLTDFSSRTFEEENDVREFGVSLSGFKKKVKNIKETLFPSVDRFIKDLKEFLKENQEHKIQVSAGGDIAGYGFILSLIDRSDRQVLKDFFEQIPRTGFIVPFLKAVSTTDLELAQKLLDNKEYGRNQFYIRKLMEQHMIIGNMKSVLRSNTIKLGLKTSSFNRTLKKNEEGTYDLVYTRPFDEYLTLEERDVTEVRSIDLTQFRDNFRNNFVWLLKSDKVLEDLSFLK